MFKNVDFRFRETPKTPWERKPCPRDPPRRAPEPALELQGPPRTVPRAPQSPQGPQQIHKVGMLKTLEICVFGTQESEKNGLGPFFDGPSTLPRAPRAATLRSKVTFGRPKSLFGAPRDPPGTPKAPPGPPQTTSKNFNLPSSELKIDDFQILHVFPTFFNNFQLHKLLCKITLVSFYTYFPLILTNLRIAHVNQTPPGPPPGPPQDPSGPPQDLPRTPPKSF